ncbi:hypothetical protein Ddye_030002 [Dipteronia dyeriana]|uniref:non-specific serine/threonine protein kinase n=1 Tax=Dipteronia dyeriana TaxID=168575 RepID=A0AAD9TFH0_9ROSI|nr:hypothetical protein Ddye_030002 [Dipteronia dyeriana]
MKTSTPSSISKLTMIIISVMSFTTCQADTSYDDCAPLKCGNVTFSFPFSSPLTTGRCGLPGYQITCDDPSSGPKLLFSGRLFRVRAFFPTDRVITIVDTQLIQELTSNSCNSMYNLSNIIYSTSSNDNYNSAPLTLPEGSVNLTFYKCPSIVNFSKEIVDKIVVNISCDDGGGDGDQLYLWRNGSQLEPQNWSNPMLTSSGCDSVVVPVSSVRYVFTNDTSLKLNDALRDGFPLTWPNFDECGRCQNRSGRCGYDPSFKKIICFCKADCEHNQKPLIIGLATGSCSLVLIVVVVLLLIFRKRISLFSKKSPYYSDDHPKPGDGVLNVKQFIKTYRSTLLTNYSYNDVKKMTNGFKEKLGAGGYGSVYKGKFPDGRLVAVKMLDKSNEYYISHNFINEVSTVGRIYHVNVINLLGFCCDDSTRALIYEYMPNGSLGDLLSREKANVSLGLVKFLEIALRVAHAIEYLHNGCELRILHLDIKPENVLLDKDFSPKISDFGLAKMHSRNKSVVTMTGAGGTIGYIAPEIFLRHLGNPSHKSDVYSYGMLLLEMACGRKNVEPITSTSSTEAYFPDWIYDKIFEKQDLKHGDGDSDLVEIEEEEEACMARKMMIMVGLWCIQINPRHRSSMTRVVEMLSGNLEAIEMPPKPSFLSSLSNVQLESEIISNYSDTSDLPLTSTSQ